MSIRPVELSGMVQRTQDVSTIKQNADNKPFFEQQNINAKQQKETMQTLKHVKHGEDAQNHKGKYDARDKSNNEYEKQDSKTKKLKEENGKVVKKAVYGGFDMKI